MTTGLLRRTNRTLPAPDARQALPRNPPSLTTLAPGRYTAIVRGVGATSGVALVEVYDQDSGPGSLLANLSKRSGVGTGNNVMIGGIILTGQKTIIVRALGPTLTQFGVANALNDPALELRNAQGALLDSERQLAIQPEERANSGEWACSA
jgi:hypothetical protein